MALQYHCSNEARRAAVRAVNVGPNYIQGIDYVEVLDARDGDIGPAAAQYTILVVALAPWNLVIGSTTPILPTSITFSGGTHIQVECSYVSRLATFSASDPVVADIFDGDEADYIESLRIASPPPPRSYPLDRTLVVRVRERGDFSTYTLTIASLPLLAGQRLDPILRSVEFSFKAGCPAPLDCEEDEPACGAEASTTPNIDYVARDFNSFRQLMLDRLAVVLPQWKERSAADLGMTLIELVAYVADQMAYHQDAVATEAYLHTARKRISVRRHARLLDYPMHDGCNARAWVALRVAAADPFSIPAETTFFTKVAGLPVVLDADDHLTELLQQDPEAFETLHAVEVHASRNSIDLHTWYDTQCCLPKGATRATVWMPTPNTAAPLEVGDVLLLEEVKSPDTDLPADADPAHRQAVRLTAIEEVFDPLYTGANRLYDITWHDDDALTFAARLGEDGKCYAFRGNVVLVDHGYRRTGESLTPAAATASRYRPRLPDTDVTFAGEYDHEAAEEGSAAAAVTQDPTAARGWVRLSGDTGTWSPQRDLLSSDAFAREFVVETEEDGRAWLRFGDGVTGAIPPEGDEMSVTWRQGNGLKGNVGARAIYHVLDATLTGIEEIWNPLPATGGTDPEPLADVRRFAPVAFRTQRRAVTAADYETILAEHPEVQVAKARLRWTGSWKTMYIALDRKGGVEVDDDFLEEIAEFLEPYRMMGVDLELRPPQIVGLDILLSVCVEETYSKAAVRAALLLAFSARDNPDGTRGFFHPDNFTFGDTLHFSQLIAHAMKVDGVNHVFTSYSDALSEVVGTEDGAIRFRRWGEGDRGELTAGYIETGTFEILRVDNDRANPERGIIRFLMLGGR